MPNFPGGRLCFIAIIALVNFAISFFSLHQVNFAYASDEPFTGPANWGGTGLMEVPTARVMKENRYRFGAAQVHPYRYYYFAMGLLERLEVNATVTEVIGVKASPDSPAWSGYGNEKDKSLDLKLQIAREGKYIPAVAFGVMDPQGTRIFSSQYIAASKQIYPFDFTVGLGNGRFGKRSLPSSGDRFKLEIFEDPNGWWSDSQFFWGIQFAPSEKYAFMMEYNPIKYEKQMLDPARKEYFDKPVQSKFNFGFRWRPFKWSELVLSYQRGNEIGINFSMQFDIGNPIIPIYDKPYREGEKEMNAPICERIEIALSQSGFSDIAVFIKNNMIFIEAQNDKYLYSTRAIGIILNLLVEMLPGDIDGIRIVFHRNRIPIFEYSTNLADIKDLKRDRMEPWEFYLLSRIDTNVSELSGKAGKYKKFFDYGIRPDFKTFLNDPSGFFKYRLGVAGWLSFQPWKGASFIGELLTYPLNTVSTVNEPLSIPVRSDLVYYLEKNMILSKLMFEQMYKTDNGIYAKLGAGILEVEYTGLDGEIARPLKDGRFVVGLSGSLTKKREVGKAFELKKDDVKDYYSTAFLNGRLNIPEKEVYIDVMAGRFLAGDKGVRVTVSKYIKGVTISAWYSFTDTSVFSDSFNRGYNDKGIRISIPLRLFEGTDSRTILSYALSPWTRDVAQDINHNTNLFDFIGRDSKLYLDKDKKLMQ